MTIKLNVKSQKRFLTTREAVKLVTEKLENMPYFPIKFIGVRSSQGEEYMLFKFKGRLFRETKMTRNRDGIGICLEEVKVVA